MTNIPQSAETSMALRFSKNSYMDIPRTSKIDNDENTLLDDTPDPGGFSNVLTLTLGPIGQHSRRCIVSHALSLHAVDLAGELQHFLH